MMQNMLVTTQSQPCFPGESGLASFTGAKDGGSGSENGEV